MASVFQDAYQADCFTILYSLGSKPLLYWDHKVRNGHIKRLTDEDLGSLALEVVGNNVATTFVTCPAAPGATLGIKLPYLGLLVKNLKKYFTFEIEVLDDNNVRRRFQASTYNKSTRVTNFMCTMPLHLDPGWNQVQFDLADFTRRAYSTGYVETLRITIHANCRLRRVFFTERPCCEEELPHGGAVTMGVGQPLCYREPAQRPAGRQRPGLAEQSTGEECRTHKFVGASAAERRQAMRHKPWEERPKGSASPASASTAASEGDLEERSMCSERGGLASLAEEEEEEEAEDKRDQCGLPPLAAQQPHQALLETTQDPRRFLQQRVNRERRRSPIAGVRQRTPSPAARENVR